MIIVYGIKNCDTVQRALARLKDEGIEFRFHDFKAEGLSSERAARWIAALGVDTVVNRKGTTWRKLDAQAQAEVAQGEAAKVLASHPSLVKRPVIESPKGITVGFAKADEDAVLSRLK
jgi:arsenate reductase